MLERIIIAALLWGMCKAQSQHTVPGALQVVDFTGTDFLFFGEPLTYINLFSHARVQLNAMLSFASERRRMLERNIWASPDTAISELTLSHRLKHGKSTVVQFRAVWANSMSTRIDGAYLTPAGVTKRGVRVLQGFQKRELWDTRVDGRQIPGARQGVTLITPLFTAWVWASTPEWPGVPGRRQETFPGLNLRMVMHMDPATQLRAHGLLGGSLARVNSSRPLVCHMANLELPTDAWASHKPNTAASGELLGRHDGTEADYRVAGPLATDFQWNKFQGQGIEQQPADYEARVARLKAQAFVLGL